MLHTTSDSCMAKENKTIFLTETHTELTICRDIICSSLFCLDFFTSLIARAFESKSQQTCT